MRVGILGSGLMGSKLGTVWSEFMVVEAYRSKGQEAVLSFTTAR